MRNDKTCQQSLTFVVNFNVILCNALISLSIARVQYHLNK